MASVTANVLRPNNFIRLAILWPLPVILTYLTWIFQKVCRSAEGARFPRSSPEFAPIDARLACIVTGASSGIGKVTAEALALHGYHVILAGRSKSRLLEVIRELKGKHGSLSLEVLELDLQSTSSILAFKDAVNASLQSCEPARSLQLLVNNAAIFACSQRWTAEGFDSMIASNYLGPYLLTRQLLPVLLNGSPHARIVNVVSFTHRCVKEIQVNEELLSCGILESSLLKGSWYNLARIYETSKLCVVMFTYELHRRLSGSKEFAKFSVLAADPGIVQTNILRELPGWLKFCVFIVLKLSGLSQSPKTGAEAVIDAALAPQGVSGKYFFGGKGRVLQSSSLSYDVDLGNQLWETTSSLFSRISAKHSKGKQ